MEDTPVPSVGQQRMPSIQESLASIAASLALFVSVFQQHPRESVSAQPRENDRETVAIAALAKHGSNLSAIARAVGVDRRTLYKWERFMECYRRYRPASVRSRPSGYKTADGDVEAWN